MFRSYLCPTRRHNIRGINHTRDLPGTTFQEQHAPQIRTIRPCAAPLKLLTFFSFKMFTINLPRNMEQRRHKINTAIQTLTKVYKLLTFAGFIIRSRYYAPDRRDTFCSLGATVASPPPPEALRPFFRRSTFNVWLKDFFIKIKNILIIQINVHWFGDREERRKDYILPLSSQPWSFITLLTSDSSSIPPECL